MKKKYSRRRLTAKQQAFADLMLLNPTMPLSHAAAAAGYEKNSAHTAANKLLKSEIVLKYMNSKTERVAKKMQITIEEKMKKLWETVEACQNGAASKNGTTYNATGLVAAISELNRMQGHYKLDKQINDNVEELKEQLKVLVEKNRREY